MTVPKRKHKPKGRKTGRQPAPYPEPVSLGHQKLLGIVKASSVTEVARATGADEPTVRAWLREGATPRRPQQDRLRGAYGIQWADWSRRPVPPDNPAELAAEGMGLPVTPDPVPPAAPPELPGDSLEQMDQALRQIEQSLVGATPSAQASLISTKARLIDRREELRLSRVSERDRLLSCPMLRGYYRVAVEVLRPALGDDWPALADRIAKAWDAVRDDGTTPEGFEP